ncbi:MAG TPA: rhomboid family intramembrane serine protease [Saprospiraceae bacterium]|nr:rhomboid family intramembrane serine protease [Saprospiraceae bacterium]
MIITYLIIGFTALISIMAFNNHDLFLKMKHWPYEEARRGEYYRWLTSGFLHGDPMHLIFNMLTLYFFGKYVEAWFGVLFPGIGGLVYLFFYLVAIVAASSATYQKHKNTPNFASIGASGAVAAVLFACILLDPTIGIMMFFIPIPIPGFIFGVLYLWYSSYAAQKGGDNIDHTAHFFGAVFGFFFPLLLKPSLFLHFIEQLQNWL